MDTSDWAVEGMSRDLQGITRDWQLLGQSLIDGVALKEVANVMSGYGVLTEIYRSDWGLDAMPVTQVFQSSLNPGGISGWHAHGETTDRLFVSTGTMRIVLYDSRRSSPTYKGVNEFRLGVQRPALVVIPPGVWHAVENTCATPSLLLNAVDVAYRYESPDHFRLPIDTPHIPYRFQNRPGRALDSVTSR